MPHRRTHGVEIPASRVLLPAADVAAIAAIITILRPFGTGDTRRILETIAMYFGYRVIFSAS